NQQKEPEFSRPKRKFDYTEVLSEYTAAFNEAGFITREGEDAATVAMRIRGSPIRNALLPALDDWAGKSEGPQRAWLLEVARRAARQPVRDRLREPALWEDAAALATQVGAADARVLSPQFLAVVARRVRNAGGDAVPLLSSAQRRHPDDFWINYE